MPPREIPGFYYDAERNKYFRIQPNHRVQQGTAHSSSAVKARKEADEIERNKHVRQVREQQGQVRRLSTSTHTGLTLALRLGQRPHAVLNSLSQNFAARLQPWSATLGHLRQLCSFSITPSGQVYVAILGGGTPMTVIHSTASPKPCTVMVPLHAHLGLNWAAMTSVAGRYLLNSTGSSLLITPLHGNDTDTVTTHNRYHTTIIWDMATSPDDNSPHIALATSNGLYVGEVPIHRPPPQLCSSLSTEQRCVTFKGPHIVMSGERSGAVNFTDIRAPSTVHRLHHASGVNGITTSRSPNHILVNGLGSAAIYDLRYTKAIPQTKKGARTSHDSRPREHRARRHHQQPPAPPSAPTPSAPLIPFYIPPTHKTDHYHPGKTLAYMPALDIAAITTQAFDPKSYSQGLGSVLLYAASTGSLLPSALSSAHQFTDLVGLAVARVRDGPESIFVGDRHALHEFRIDLPQSADLELRDEDLTCRLASAPAPHRTPIRPVNVFELGAARFPPDADTDVVKLWT